MSSTIDPEKVLRDLNELWITLGQQAGNGDSGGVLRACAMTLFVLIDEADDTQNVMETLAALMREHPSRAILIRLRSTEEAVLEARVFAQCWMPFGHREQICCEQIEITASHSTLADVPAVLVALVVGDLPVIFWCRSARVFVQPAFLELSKIAQKTVIDSAAFSSPREILSELALAVRRGQNLADLSWARLTRWRELIAQIFENPEYSTRLARVSEAKVLYGGPLIPVSGYYLAAWLLNGLRKATSTCNLHFEPCDSRADLACIQLRAASDGLDVSLTLAEGFAEVRVDGLVNRTVFPPANDYVLLREELSITGRDEIYEQTLAAAANLAGQPEAGW